MKKNYLVIVFLLLAPLFLFFHKNADKNPGKFKFSVTFSENLSKESFDGRLLLMISDNNRREPRFQVSFSGRTQLIFGLNVDNFKAGEEAVFDADIFGFPVKSTGEIPAGEYYVQALLQKYETFKRADGHLLKLPMDQGEGRKWNRAPGNFLSKPVKISFDPQKEETFKINMTEVIPSVPLPKDTKYIKHIKIKSEKLSKFWGRDMYLGAHILLPEGWDTHPEAKYPLGINHDHWSYDFRGFRETPADKNATGRRKTYQESAHNFYKTWTGKDFPRMVLIKIQHANPYYDDSYAVNSVNVGPYGDAITYELIPHIEKEFRCIGKGWARFLYGGSTGGWEALGAQIFYPDEYNGCWASCPDPVDFRWYQIVDIYRHKNAYYTDSKWKPNPRPGARNYLGETSSTVEEQNHYELVLGTKNRSGEQWDIWEAVFSSIGKDGYPERVWDKKTGEINHKVAEYWKKNYDLRNILERDWKILGPKLKSKIHIFTGDMDTYHLNNAVYLLEEFLKNTKDPFYDGVIEYGDRFEHCWSGVHDQPNFVSAQTYNQRFVLKALDHFLKTAPKGADLKSWRY